MSDKERIRKLLNNLNIGAAKEELGDYITGLEDRIDALDGGGSGTVLTGASFDTGTNILTFTTNDADVTVDLSSLAT